MKITLTILQRILTKRNHKKVNKNEDSQSVI